MIAWLSDAAALAAALGPVRLAQPARAGGLGEHPRRQAGEGAEFWQFRPVMAGEPAAVIDWRRSGRSDQLYARERERAQPGQLWIWLDPAPSMAFASSAAVPEKRQRGGVMLLALALAAIAAGERAGVPGRGSGTDPAALAARLTASAPIDWRQVRRGEPLVVASDFLSTAPAALPLVGGAAIHLLDPAERDFPLTGDLLVEAEAGGLRQRLAPAEEVRGRYMEALGSHRARVAAEAAAQQAALFEHATDAAPAALLRTLAARLGNAG